MNEELDLISQRTRQYWFIDGIVELSIGGLFSILGIYFYLQSTFPSGSFVLISLQVGFFFLLMGVMFLSRYLVRIFKSRLTTPRTGYVSYKRASKKQRIVSVCIVFLLTALNAALFLAAPLSLNWIPAITGLIVGSLWLISAIRVGLFRFYLQSIAAFLLGVVLSLTSLAIYQSLALFYGILGSLLILSGGVTLTNYLHQHPSSEEKPQA